MGLFPLALLYLSALAVAASWADPAQARHGHAAAGRSPKIKYSPALSAELSQMAARDQAVRREYPDTPTNATTFYEAGYEYGYVEAANTARLQQIISRCGWPGKAPVGAVGADNAWLLMPGF